MLLATICSGAVVPDGGARAAGTAATKGALEALGHTSVRFAGSLPNPALAAGVDTLPGVDHIVVLMLENHSYDNLLGMLGRGGSKTGPGVIPPPGSVSR
jgi:phospholipase C